MIFIFIHEIYYCRRNIGFLFFFTSIDEKPIFRLQTKSVSPKTVPEQLHILQHHIFILIIKE